MDEVSSPQQEIQVKVNKWWASTAPLLSWFCASLAGSKWVLLEADRSGIVNLKRVWFMQSQNLEPLTQLTAVKWSYWRHTQATPPLSGLAESAASVGTTDRPKNSEDMEEWTVASLVLPFFGLLVLIKLVIVIFFRSNIYLKIQQWPGTCSDHFPKYIM